MTTHPLPGDGSSLTDQPAARYSGRRYRDQSGQEVTVVTREDGEGIGRPLPVRLDLRNHSPDSFAWGYGGSGPAQLALAILADALGDRKAQRHYQDFKWAFIAKLDQEQPWTISREQVMEWIGQQRQQGR